MAMTPHYSGAIVKLGRRRSREFIRQATSSCCSFDSVVGSDRGNDAPATSLCGLECKIIVFTAGPELPEYETSHASAKLEACSIII